MQTASIAAPPILKPARPSAEPASLPAQGFGETLAHSMKDREAGSTSSSISAVRGRKLTSTASPAKPQKDRDADSSSSSPTSAPSITRTDSRETPVLPTHSANNDVDSKNDAVEKTSAGSARFAELVPGLVGESSVDPIVVRETASRMTNTSPIDSSVAAPSVLLADAALAEQGISANSVPSNASSNPEHDFAETRPRSEIGSSQPGTPTDVFVTTNSRSTAQPAIQANPAVLEMIPDIPGPEQSARVSAIPKASPQPGSDLAAEPTPQPEASANQSAAHLFSEPESQATSRPEAAQLPFSFFALEVGTHTRAVGNSKQDSPAEASQPSVAQNIAPQALRVAISAQQPTLTNGPSTSFAPDKPAAPQNVAAQPTTPVKPRSVPTPQISGVSQLPMEVANAVTGSGDQVRERQPEALRASVESLVWPGLHRFTQADTTPTPSSHRMRPPSPEIVGPAETKEMASAKTHTAVCADTRETTVTTADSQRKSSAGAPTSFQETASPATTTKEAPVVPAPANSPAPAASAASTKATHELPVSHQMLDSVATPVAANPNPHITTQPAGDAEMRVGIRTAAFGALEIYTSVHQNQVGIAVHGGRDLTQWFSSEVQNLESGLRDHHLNLTTVELDHTTSGFQAGTGSHRHTSPEYTRPSQFSGVPQMDKIAQTELLNPLAGLEYSVHNNHVSIRI